MKIGVRNSPHLETLLAGIKRVGGVTLTSSHDSGADFYLCWGWPQAEQVARDNGGQNERIICIDAHPFALKAGERRGSRIFQLGNWGYLAQYPEIQPVYYGFPFCPPAPRRQDPAGYVLVLGHVDSTEQQRQGLIDTWCTPGGDAWLREEMSKPNRVLRPHPRMWLGTEPQPSLETELKGSSYAVAWNSTAVIHARMLGYQAKCIEPHGWGWFDMHRLGSLEVMPEHLRSGEYWDVVYLPWLKSLQLKREVKTWPRSARC